MEEENQQKLFDNRKLAELLIPLAVDQLLNSFMGTVDTLVVSNLGSAAISAVSLVDSINILIVQAFFRSGDRRYGGLFPLSGVQAGRACKRGSKAACVYHIYDVAGHRGAVHYF